MQPHSTPSIQPSSSPPPYRSHATYLPRKFRLLNIILFIILVALAFVLFFMVLPKSLFSADCIWSAGGHRCFWPFGQKPPVILINFDGFRHDYIAMVRRRMGSNALPNFERLQTNGVHVNRVFNVFPTVAASNLHTLVTGLYPQHHGVTNNILYDRNFSLHRFDFHNQTSLDQSPWLDHWPEPIWVTAQRQLDLVGTLLWPFTDRPVRDDQPFQIVPQFAALNDQKHAYSDEKRIETLLHWIHNEYYQLDLVLAYFPEPGYSGEIYGPESTEMVEAVVRMDEILGKLLDGLERLKLKDNVELILTSGHAQADTHDENKRIQLNQFVDPTYYEYTSLNAFGAIYPKKGYENEVFQRLYGAHSNLNVYWLKDVPSYLHYNQSNIRMPPIVLIPQLGWSIVQGIDDPIPRGSSGYPPTHPDMNTIFMASGPSFRVNETVAQAHSIDIYELLCALVRTKAQPNNGSLERISITLKPSVAEKLLRRHRWPEWIKWVATELQQLWLMIGLVALFTVTAALSLSLIWQHKRRLRQPEPQVWYRPPEYDVAEKVQK